MRKKMGYGRHGVIFGDMVEFRFYKVVEGVFKGM